MPARLLQALWARTEFPPVELLAGRCDVFHATNFVLPPTRRAVGVVTVHDLTYLRHADTVTAATLRYRELVPRSVARAALVLCDAEATAADVAAEYGLSADRVVATPLGVSDEWRSADAAHRERSGPRSAFPSATSCSSAPASRASGCPTWSPPIGLARAADDAVPPLVLAGPAGWGAPVDAPDAIRTGYLDAAGASVAGRRRDLPGAARPSYEGFGLPVLEALACGAPVIASDLPVHREITGGHAILVPVGDVDALAAALVAASRAGRPELQRKRRRRAWASAVHLGAVRRADHRRLSARAGLSAASATPTSAAPAETASPGSAVRLAVRELDLVRARVDGHRDVPVVSHPQLGRLPVDGRPERVGERVGDDEVARSGRLDGHPDRVAGVLDHLAPSPSRTRRSGRAGQHHVCAAHPPCSMPRSSAAASGSTAEVPAHRIRGSASSPFVDGRLAGPDQSQPVVGWLDRPPAAASTVAPSSRRPRAGGRAAKRQLGDESATRSGRRWSSPASATTTSPTADRRRSRLDSR